MLIISVLKSATIWYFFKQYDKPPETVRVSSQWEVNEYGQCLLQAWGWHSYYCWCDALYLLNHLVSSVLRAMYLCMDQWDYWKQTVWFPNRHLQTTGVWKPRCSFAYTQELGESKSRTRGIRLCLAWLLLCRAWIGLYASSMIPG